MGIRHADCLQRKQRGFVQQAGIGQSYWLGSTRQESADQHQLQRGWQGLQPGPQHKRRHDRLKQALGMVSAGAYEKLAHPAIPWR